MSPISAVSQSLESSLDFRPRMIQLKARKMHRDRPHPTARPMIASSERTLIFGGEELEEISSVGTVLVVSKS